MIVKVDSISVQNVARLTFCDHFLLKYTQSNATERMKLTTHISKESDRKKSITQHFALNGNRP
jgi:hypothetical protein